MLACAQVMVCADDGARASENRSLCRYWTTYDQLMVRGSNIRMKLSIRRDEFTKNKFVIDMKFAIVPLYSHR